MKTDIFHALNNIDDEYVLEAAQYIEKKKYRKVLGTAAAIICVIILNVANPVLARSLPFVGSVFEYLQNKLDFTGSYDEYADGIEIAAKSKGINVEVQEAYCDGENLFVSYRIQSEKPFSEYTTEKYLKTQLDFEGLTWVLAEGKALQINDFGVSGLEGEFIDEYTFVGVDTIRLAEGEFPNEFTYGFQVYKWNLLLENGPQVDIKGYWDLSIPIKVNKTDVNIIEVNASNRQHNIDKLVVSPIMATIYTSYPDIYNDSVNYEVVVFSEKQDGNISFQAEYGSTKGKTWIPRSMIGDTIDIYVVDFSTFTVQGAVAYEREQIEKNAIVSTHIELNP